MSCSICPKPTMFKIEDSELCADHAREWLKAEANGEKQFAIWLESHKVIGEPEPSIQIEVTLNEKRDTMLLIFDQPMQYAGLGRQAAMALAGHMMNLAGKMK